MTDQRIIPYQRVIPYLDGDGIGPEIMTATRRVLDAAVARAYAGTRALAWRELLAGDEAHARTGEYLPAETIAVFREHRVGLKGPLSTPLGGHRSLNITLREQLDLYVNLRPIRWIRGAPSPVRRPELTDVALFRENTEDIYAGIEFMSGSEDLGVIMQLLRERFPERHAKLRFPETTGLSLKPISREGSERLIRAAIEHALAHHLPSVTLIHKGSVMKASEGLFVASGYALARREYASTAIESGPWQRIERDGHTLIIKDVMTDAFLQQMLLRPEELSVLATMSQTGDYISDALAACVGGVGLAPGVNLNPETNIAVFEACHGSAPKYRGRDMANPSALILSGELLLRALGWGEAADLLLAALERVLASERMTYDLHRQRQGATLLSCSAFADALVAELGGLGLP
jgi:isocitrate dehydrogenase